MGKIDYNSNRQKIKLKSSALGYSIAEYERICLLKCIDEDLVDPKKQVTEITCSICNEVKPKTTEFFHMNGKWLSVYCKECHRERNKINLRKARILKAKKDIQ